MFFIKLLQLTFVLFISLAANTKIVQYNRILFLFFQTSQQTQVINLRKEKKKFTKTKKKKQKKKVKLKLKL